MLHRITLAAALVSAYAATTGLLAQDEKKAKGAESRHGLTLALRSGDEDKGFSKDTKRYGIEVYQDGNNQTGLYVTEAGSGGGIAGGLFGAAADKAKIKDPEWMHGLALKARPAGERDFDKANKYGIEVFKDENNGALIYANQAGQISVIPGKYAVTTPPKEKVRDPKWAYSFDFPVRKAGEKDQAKAAKVGVEVFKDENNGNLVYISQRGFIAAVAGKLLNGDGKDGKAPFLYAMELSTRKSGENDFTKDTKKWNVEVFEDQNNGNLLYICENGSLAVVPGKQAKASGKDGKDPSHKYDFDLWVRRAGVKDFDKADGVEKIGTEVYVDENNGHTVYITDRGHLTVVSSKAD
jgi:hypothetical protein